MLTYIIKCVYRAATIIYNDEVGDRKVAILDFDQKQYVLPIKAALSEVTELR